MKKIIMVIVSCVCLSMLPYSSVAEDGMCTGTNNRQCHDGAYASAPRICLGECQFGIVILPCYKIVMLPIWSTDGYISQCFRGLHNGGADCGDTTASCTWTIGRENCDGSDDVFTNHGDPEPTTTPTGTCENT